MKSKLGGHALGPFDVLDRTNRTFTIQRDYLVERVSGDRVKKAPPPPEMTSERNSEVGTVQRANKFPRYSIPDGMDAKHYDGNIWPIHYHAHANEPTNRQSRGGRVRG